MQQTSSSKKSSSRNYIYVFTLVAAAVIALLLYYADGKLRVRFITILGISPSHTVYGLEGLKNSRLLFLNTKETESAIFDANPSLSQVSVAKEYPQTIKIKATAAKPFMYIKIEEGYALLSEKGRIMSKSKGDKLAFNLPILHHTQKFNYALVTAGDTIDRSDISRALFFVKKTQELGLKVNTVDIDGVDVIGLNLRNKAIIFSSEKDVESQVYQLGQILRQFRIQGQEFKKLDLRFNRPVLELVE